MSRPIEWAAVNRSRWTLRSPYPGSDNLPVSVIAHGAPQFDEHGVLLQVEFLDRVADRITLVDRWFPFARIVHAEVLEVELDEPAPIDKPEVKAA